MATDLFVHEFRRLEKVTRCVNHPDNALQTKIQDIQHEDSRFITYCIPCEYHLMMRCAAPLFMLAFVLDGV